MLDKTFGGLAMSKYTYEERIEAVLGVKKEGISQNKSARIHGCNRPLVGEWIALYEKHGQITYKLKSLYYEQRSH